MKLFVLESPPALGPDESAVLLDRLSDSDRQRYHSIPSRKRRLQFLLGRALLSCALDRKSKFRTSHLHGVSVSHHGDHVCAAVNPMGRVGADVHTCRVYPARVARRFFTPAENRWLQRLPDASKRDAFGALWVVKEAICKARGTGLRFPLPLLSVPPEGEGRCGQFRWALVSLSPDTVAAVAWDVTDSPLQHESVVSVALSDLLAVGNGSAH